MTPECAERKIEQLEDELERAEREIDRLKQLVFDLERERNEKQRTLTEIAHLASDDY